MVRLVVPPRVEAVWRAVDGLMHRSKWQSPSGIWEKSNSERRGKREERREKRDGSVPEGRNGAQWRVRSELWDMILHRRNDF